MLHNLFVFSGLATCALAAGIDFLPKELKAVLPPVIIKHLESLTDAEFAAQKKLAIKYIKTGHAFVHKDSFDRVLKGLKTASPSLYAKVKRLNTIIDKKVNALEPDAKRIVKELLIFLRKFYYQILGGYDKYVPFIPNAFSLQETNYKILSKKAKEDLKKEFPEFVKAVTRPLSEKS